ncbi:MAG: type II secretion system protein GspG [Firmicutes bacterium]|nr:type II secretion system protein GspG [Bacillota bacterium]
MRIRANALWQRWVHRAAEAPEDQERGLTLIEMLAVVVILGIVAAIAIPSVTSAINQSKINTTESDLGTLQSALSRYYMDNGHYPSTLSHLATNGSSLTTWNGPYIRETFPMADAWGNDVAYAQLSGNNNNASDVPGAGYLLVSGDGVPLALTSGPPYYLSSSTTNPPTKNNKLIYAAGGYAGSEYIGTGPTASSTLSNATLGSGSSAVNLLTLADSSDGTGSSADNPVGFVYK